MSQKDSRVLTKIERVAQYRLGQRVIYKGVMYASNISEITITSPLSEDASEGYNRIVKKRRIPEIRKVLQTEGESNMGEILLNVLDAEFVPYDKTHPEFGYLLVYSRFTIIDGQHRLAAMQAELENGGKDYLFSFTIYRGLTTNEELKLFEAHNAKGKSLDGSHKIALASRTGDELSQVAVWLATNKRSPFYSLMTPWGMSRNRPKGRPLELTNLLSLVTYVTRGSKKLYSLDHDTLRDLIFTYFNIVAKKAPEHWADPVGSILTRTTVLNALVFLGIPAMEACLVPIKDGDRNSYSIQSKVLEAALRNIDKVDWSTMGPHSHHSNLQGSKELAVALSGLIYLKSAA